MDGNGTDLLEENVYKKDAGNNELLTPNGWNTTRSGNGNNYPNGSYYRENASQIFYANFFAVDDKYYEIKWIITDGITTYRIARNSGKWYNVAKYENREDGVFVKAGDLITLPRIVEDEDHLKFWSSSLFGDYYIKAWYAANDDWVLQDGVVGDNWKQFEYSLGMKATDDLTFVAILSSRTEKGLECKFSDAQGNEINNSGIIANGASAYMAWSGMDAKTIKVYSEGYNNWVERYGNTQLTTTPTGFVEYNLGNKSVIETPTENEEDETGVGLSDYMIMFIILGSGVITTVASLGAYIVVRSKNRKSIVNLKKFKEEKRKA